MRDFCARVAHLKVTVFLSQPERDAGTNNLYNSVFVIGADGRVLGHHRKIAVLPSGSESWSTAGVTIEPIEVPSIGTVGVMICADAYPPPIAQRLKAAGATLLLSAAAWAPGMHGPDGEWERCTRDTGLALIVCNRTGPDRTLDFSAAESVVVQDGEKALSMTSARSAIFLLEWDHTRHRLHRREFGTIGIEI